MTISEAKFRVYNKFPFFGGILFNLPVEETEEVPTLGVDGEKLYVNPKYWGNLTNGQQMGVLMHEAGHLFLGHVWRGKNFDGLAIDPTNGQAIRVYNLAGDAVINLMIKADDRFDLPSGCFIKDKYVNWGTEEVYHDLIKGMPKMTANDLKKLIKGSFCDKSGWRKTGEGSKKDKEQQERWNNIAKQAAEAQKQKGEVPAYLKGFFDSLEPKEDWRNVLREYVQPFISDYSFNPVDRRFLESEFVLPSIADGEKLDYVVVAIDTSGSISENELNAFLAELRGILAAYDKVKVRLTFCDAEASPFIELEEFTKDIVPTGGGGTDFAPPFKLAEKEPIPPLALIYFTDMEGNFPKSAGFDTIWVSTQRNKSAPFGRVLDYKI